ncbi:hypothetical protein LAZ67_1006170 [Cordylochernes scorpioides]|uniref:Tc1-like transposase DDE domain-containing protein n=1 Tax=Cordylochernes scorpioides TaxID=51811 RepID=A0ABY6K0B5_9ARAC|nr:hypothetical protein LAZ67_1006170 [Cordylochernes scorpioides]
MRQSRWHLRGKRRYTAEVLASLKWTVPPLLLGASPPLGLLEDPAVLIPVATASAVLLMVAAVTLAVLLWRRRAPPDQELCKLHSIPFGISTGGTAVSGLFNRGPIAQDSRTTAGRPDDNISMSSYGKSKSIFEQPREQLYYPLPYASSHVPPPQGPGHEYLQEDGRPHTYDVPHRVQTLLRIKTSQKHNNSTNLEFNWCGCIPLGVRLLRNSVGSYFASPHSNTPTVNTEETLTHVCAFLRMMAEVLHINKETNRTIMHEDLGKTKVCAKFVPHTLTGEQKSLRIALCRDIISAYENDSNFLKSIVTGDEAWCFHYDPKTKRQMPSKIKTMLITFFDSRGFIQKEFVPAGQTVTGEYYLKVLKRLIARIRRIRPEYRDEDSWCLLHDNASSHSSLIVRRFLAKNNVCVLNHPPKEPKKWLLSIPDSGQTEIIAIPLPLGERKAFMLKNRLPIDIGIHAALPIQSTRMLHSWQCLHKLRVRYIERRKSYVIITIVSKIEVTLVHLDNARPHRALMINEYLESEDIQRMECPARSLDLNPIEHVWDVLRRRIGSRSPPPRITQKLKTTLVEEWDLLPQELSNCLINSMEYRSDSCLAVRGDLVVEGEINKQRIHEEASGRQEGIGRGGFWQERITSIGAAYANWRTKGLKQRLTN